MRKILLILALFILCLLLWGCTEQKEVTAPPQDIKITYIYDEVHQVCIWHSESSYAEAIAVLPARDVANPELLPNWAKELK